LSGLTDVNHAVALAKTALDDRCDAQGLEVGPDSRLELARVAVYAAGPLIVRQALRSAIETVKAVPAGPFEYSTGHALVVQSMVEALEALLAGVEDSPPRQLEPAGRLAVIDTAL
jgi:hypothetical protein